ncbi:MAG: transcription-repair coupling factor, partial [Candidatus Limnocylindria bacterium]
LLHVPLAQGFVVPELDLRVFTDAEVFGFRKPRHPERRRRRVAVGSFLQDLRPGDHVVHEDSGVARFERFEHKDVGGVSRESLVLTFADGTRWLPTERIDKITRYVGGGAPALSVMGGADWLRTKRRAKKAAEDIARELLRLYAAREAAFGHAFAKDAPWQIEMENAFPYTETPDQLAAVEDVKRDMEAARPMDRLIVGDVGYGKTEVALRAAFKAVMDGKQVAILVPTTVLAQQHHETFAERLATFPVEVGMLSRFRSPTEQRALVQTLATGELDIVVGTHRVLQKDVRFRDLGLVVIDEEHRFGVKHKERLKSLRTQVDVLSLTATPIPRTLHMALSAVRDISVIETPPEDRQPIETHVVERGDDVIREAILRELDRGGQVYYVHNRVIGIEQETARLRELVPNARFAIGHGQMDERALERVMVEFADAEHDVLVCTTIIESGLDIPNVNTIVVDRAGNLGLAQLYQLRGRVGRSAEKAYAYLLYHRGASLGEQARSRLQAIFEASELGAGFKIALRDLEIRGAGNILGAEQHGHVAAVGFELYAQLLEEAVSEQRGLPHAAAAPEVVVDLALSTAIPDEYVPSRTRKLETYRRIAELRALEDLAALREELRDRYGAPPEPMRNLLYGVEVKIRAARAGATEVRARGPELRVVMASDITPAQRAAVLAAFPRAQHGQRQIRVSRLELRGDWRDALTRLLDGLAA